MCKLTFEKRVWIVKQYQKGLETSKIALSQKVTRMTISKIFQTILGITMEQGLI